MFKRIGTRRYDTEKADYVGRDPNDNKIYRKRNGEYFLVNGEKIELLNVSDVPNRNTGGDDRTSLHARISQRTKEKLLKYAADKKISIGEAIDRIIEGVKI